MTIYIDGNALDVTLENEQTVGDLFASLETWLSQTGFRCTAFALDGKNIHAGEVEKAFSTGIDDVARIDIQTTSVAQLYADTLLDTAFFLTQYSGVDTGENGKDEIVRAWNESGGRSFLFENYPGFAKKIDDYLVREQGDGAKLGEEIAERLREITDPKAALLSMKEKIYGITVRLEVLSLNMQMGKDREATETVYDFSEIAEKLFRIIQLMPLAVGGTEDVNFFEEFTGVLKEFFHAYQAQDSVLAGDLAEYEVSPRLLELYDRLKEWNVLSDLTGTDTSGFDAAFSSAAAESIAKAC
ncbi:MAG: hypothetical protein LBG27_12820 [Spirochaetaceae bacterium]|jgi:hypothetical protein|nr:hypothetical protein [Spirochaetaceae bacterium]